MKKTLTLLFAAAMLIAAGCKKSDSNTPSGNNSWTLAGVTYKTAITNKSTTSIGNTLIYFWDAQPTTDLKVNSIALSFKTAPTTSGTYKLVGGAGGTLTGNQFELSAGTHTSAYAYIGAAMDVNITVTNGKARIEIPEITLKSTSSSPDAKLSASVQEL